MSQPEFIKDRSSEEIFTGHEPENHPLRNSLLNKLDIFAWGAIILPGYAGLGILGFGGAMDENIRNISFGMIGWTLTGAGFIYFAPRIARKVASVSLGILEDIVKMGHHGSDHL